MFQSDSLQQQVNHFNELFLFFAKNRQKLAIFVASYRHIYDFRALANFLNLVKCDFIILWLFSFLKVERILELRNLTFHGTHSKKYPWPIKKTNERYNKNDVTNDVTTQNDDFVIISVKCVLSVSVSFVSVSFVSVSFVSLSRNGLSYYDQKYKPKTDSKHYVWCGAVVLNLFSSRHTKLKKKSGGTHLPRFFRKIVIF